MLEHTLLKLLQCTHVCIAYLFFERLLPAQTAYRTSAHLGNSEAFTLVIPNRVDQCLAETLF